MLHATFTPPTSTFGNGAILTFAFGLVLPRDHMKIDKKQIPASSVERGAPASLVGPYNIFQEHWVPSFSCLPRPPRHPLNVKVAAVILSSFTYALPSLILIENTLIYQYSLTFQHLSVRWDDRSIHNIVCTPEVQKMNMKMNIPRSFPTVPYSGRDYISREDNSAWLRQHVWLHPAYPRGDFCRAAS